jgi:hypothetical protein
VQQVGRGGEIRVGGRRGIAGTTKCEALAGSAHRRVHIRSERVRKRGAEWGYVRAMECGSSVASNKTVASFIDMLLTSRHLRWQA